jgi:YbbR domain-containing protein
VTRVLRFITHNWQVKVGAVALATLLYGGLVVSQSTRPWVNPVPIRVVNQPSGIIVLSPPGDVTRIEYVVPANLGLRIDGATFQASVDLGDVDLTAESVTVRVSVEAIDERVQVLAIEPAQIVLRLDRVESRSVPIRAALGPLPSGLEAGDPVVDGTTATVRGPQSIVSTITEVQAPVAIDASGIDIDQLVDLVPVDDAGTAVGPLTPIEVEPAQVRVRVPVFTDRRSKTVPVSPVVVGTPAAGFEVASVVVDPPVVSVEGDANDLATLDRADTQPISVSGASSQVELVAELALPDGVQPLGPGTVAVTVTLRPITATRTFEAGLVLSGASANLRYQLSTDRVLVTIAGSVADLDRLATTALVLTVDVTGLEVGTHTVPVSANLTTGLTLIGASPNPLEVIVSSPGATPAPSVSPSATSP